MGILMLLWETLGYLSHAENLFYDTILFTDAFVLYFFICSSILVYSTSNLHTTLFWSSMATSMHNYFNTFIQVSTFSGLWYRKGREHLMFLSPRTLELFPNLVVADCIACRLCFLCLINFWYLLHGLPNNNICSLISHSLLQPFQVHLAKEN